LTGRTAFTFRESGAEIVRCLRCALIYMQMVRRSVLAALVVGSVLTMLNQGDVLVSGSWPDALYWKLPLTYATPVVVATWGALTNARR
jgi:hypothetical protein